MKRWPFEMKILVVAMYLQETKNVSKIHTKDKDETPKLSTAENKWEKAATL